MSMNKHRNQIAFLPLSMLIAYLTPISILLSWAILFQIFERDGYRQKFNMDPLSREVFFYTFSFITLGVIPFIAGYCLLSLTNWALRKLGKNWAIYQWTKVAITVIGMAIYFLFLQEQFPFTFSPD
jgi:hypothetical protein